MTITCISTFRTHKGDNYFNGDTIEESVYRNLSRKERLKFTEGSGESYLRSIEKSRTKKPLPVTVPQKPLPPLESTKKKVEEDDYPKKDDNYDLEIYLGCLYVATIMNQD